MKYNENEIKEMIKEKLYNFNTPLWNVMIPYDEENLEFLENTFKDEIAEEVLYNNNTNLNFEDIIDKVTNIFLEEYKDDIWEAKYDAFEKLVQKALNEVIKEKHLTNIDLDDLDDGDFVDNIFEDYWDLQELDYDIENTLKTIRENHRI